VLELEWRHLKAGGNAGIFVWASPLTAPGTPFLKAVEVQVLDNDYNAKGKNEWYTTHGDVFPIHGMTMEPFGRHHGMRSFPSAERSRSSPEWNHYRVHAQDGIIRLSVNGYEVSGGKNCSWQRGYLGLESEGSPTEWRNVRIKILKATEAPVEKSAPAAENFRPLYTGIDLQGWDTPAPDAWKHGGWTLSGAPQAQLTSKDSFGTMELIFDARCPDGGLEVHFRGARLTIPANNSWQRYHLKASVDEITLQGQRTPFAAGAAAQSPITFQLGKAKTELASIFVKQ
jgi:hypothetical protein